MGLKQKKNQERGKGEKEKKKEMKDAYTPQDNTTVEETIEKDSCVSVWCKRLVVFIAILCLPAMMNSGALVHEGAHFLPSVEMFYQLPQRSFLYLECMGDAVDNNTIIIEGDLGTTAEDYRPLMKELAETHRVCIYDREGLGHSGEFTRAQDAVNPHRSRPDDKPIDGTFQFLGEDVEEFDEEDSEDEQNAESPGPQENAQRVTDNKKPHGGNGDGDGDDVVVADDNETERSHDDSQHVPSDGADDAIPSSNPAPVKATGKPGTAERVAQNLHCLIEEARKNSTLTTPITLVSFGTSSMFSVFLASLYATDVNQLVLFNPMHEQLFNENPRDSIFTQHWFSTIVSALHFQGLSALVGLTRFAFLLNVFHLPQTAGNDMYQKYIACNYFHQLEALHEFSLVNETAQQVHILSQFKQLPAETKRVVFASVDEPYKYARDERVRALWRQGVDAVASNLHTTVQTVPSISMRTEQDVKKVATIILKVLSEQANTDTEL
eukprot:m.28594 g.28594  ORF g.28594 m.28594 type:complete len:494 (-) comp6069_c0_seq1:81-1562(-)